MSAIAGPLLYVRTQPQTRPTAAALNHWSRHVVVAPQIRAHTVGVRQPEDLSDLVGVDEVLGSNGGRHDRTLRSCCDIEQ